MRVITPQFVFDLESRMRFIQENEYFRLAQNLWWNKCTKVIPSGARREIVTWALNTAQIESQGQGGNIAFDNMTIIETEYAPETAGKGLKLRRQQFEDLDGNGVNLATEWAGQIGAQQAYWPQKLAVQFLKNGETGISYDGLSFFNASHPLNPKNTSAGTYSNLFTGVDLGDLDDPADAALANLATVFSNIASIKMPNGVDPRFLKPSAIICGPKLFPRLAQLTNARFIAQAATGGGGGSGDVEALISALAYGTPIMASEFAGFEDDTTYFVLAEQLSSMQLGGLVYVDREPFSVRYYTGRGGGNGVDAILDRADELEWHTSGRNAMGYGHPFTIFKCKA